MSRQRIDRNFGRLAGNLLFISTHAKPQNRAAGPLTNRYREIILAGTLTLQRSAQVGRTPSSAREPLFALLQPLAILTRDTNLDRIEAETLGQINQMTLDRQGQIHTLGKLLLLDKHLSVNQNEASSNGF